jgi:PAS domain S-box-containing protein
MRPEEPLELSSYSGSKKCKVLNVDDTRDSLRIKTVTLQRAGFDVVEATSGEEALQLTAKHKPDVVLLDVNLPDSSGFEVCRRIKANPATASTLVLQISACFTKGSDRTKGLEGGADGYLTSPVEPPLLVATIKSLLRVRETEGAQNPLFQYWEATFDAVAGGIALLDGEGRILKCNAAWETLLGKTSSEMLGRRLRAVLSFQSPTDEAGAPFLNTRSRGRQSLEITRTGKWLQITTDPIISPEGHLLGTVCTLNDATDRKRLESSLQHFQQLSSQARDVVLVINPDGRILDVNQATAATYGFSREELLSMNIRDLLAESATSAAEGIPAALKDCGGIYQETIHRRKDGTSFRAEVCWRCTSLGGRDAFVSIVRAAGTRPTLDQDGGGNSPLIGTHICRATQDCSFRTTIEHLKLFADPDWSNDPTRYEVGELASYNERMQEILKLLPQIAASNSTVLIQGETGTGKELLARTIHRLSPRAAKPLIAIDCGALPATLLESELFGYRAGAFTGASKDKPGQFTMAGEGTIFLDEIGDLSPALQVKLLRVLQEKTYTPLGGTASEKTEARFITATNRSLPELVKEGLFRSDLYYRINVVTLELPPLRQRKEDIPLLVERIIGKFNLEYDKEISGVAGDVMSLLQSYEFPGNIRELMNILERAHILCTMPMIELHHLPGYLTGSHPGQERIGAGKSDLRSVEVRAIMEGLKRNRYNRLATARELGIHKSTLFRKLKELGVTLPELDGRSKRKG